MSLNIKNPEAHELAAELARLTGESMTKAVTEAIRERLAGEKESATRTSSSSSSWRSRSSAPPIPVATTEVARSSSTTSADCRGDGRQLGAHVAVRSDHREHGEGPANVVA
jgi:hypothetical protein